jgi:glycoside/pentoside/hexuronide:cation symporter, GPH family
MSTSENQSVSEPKAAPAKLSVREKLGYGVGDAASNLYFYTFITFLPIFYTDVFGLPAAAMGTMFLVTRIWDAVNDPIMGMIADRTNSRWGKFRPYLLGLGLPMAVAGVLTFTTPEFSAAGKIVYAYITYTLLMMLYTAVNVPYSALMGVITPNSLERTTVSTFRFVSAFAAQMLVAGTALTLVTYLGRGSEQAGWQLTMGVYGILAVGLLAVTFFTTRERVNPPKDQQGNILQDMKDLFINKPWVLIALATVFQLTYIVMRAGSTTYYFRYYVLDQELNLFGYTAELTYTRFASSFLFIGGVSTAIGAILTKWFAEKLDKKNTYAGFLIASALFSCTFFLLQPHNVLLIFVMNVVVSFFFGSVSVLQWAIYADTADYGEWKFGRRATGLVMAASLFALKLGVALGGTFVGWLLELHNFVPLAAQAEEAMLGIRLLMSAYPAIFGIIGGLIILLFYPLTNKMMVTIEEELTARRK